MKLITRYNRVNLLTTIVVMLITGFIYYQAISLILIKQLEKNLQVEEDEIFELCLGGGERIKEYANIFDENGG